MKPLFSVVIPTHSRVQLFYQTLKSLENQTFKDFEVIITDDSPLEQDRKNIENTAIAFSRKTSIQTRYIFTKACLGQSRNTNQGLRLSSGDYVRILHSDDLLAPQALEYELKLFLHTNFKINLLFHDIIPFIDVPLFSHKIELALLSPKEYFIQYLHSSTPVPSAVSFKRSLLENAGLLREDFDFLCDWDFFIRLLDTQRKNNHFIGSFSRGLVAWRTHKNSTSGTAWDVHFHEHVQLMKELSSSSEVFDNYFLSEENSNTFFRNACTYRYKRLLLDFVKQPKIKKIRSLLGCLFSLSSLSQLSRCNKRKTNKPKIQEAEQLNLGYYFSYYIFRLTSSYLKNKPAALPKTQECKRPEVIHITFPENIEILPLEKHTCKQKDLIHIYPSFDNSISFEFIKNALLSAKTITITCINVNRFAERSLYECLKCIPVGKKLVFKLTDNDHLTFFGLKALIDKLFPDQFSWKSQSKINKKQYLIEYYRHSDTYLHLNDPHTGWTIGMLTLGNNPAFLHKFIDSVEKASHDSNYEILFISPIALPAIESFRNTRVINFDVNDNFGWITKKKNILCDQAQYSDILICHDRYTLSNSFFQDFAKFGYSYGIAAPKIKSLDDKRMLDWAVVSSENIAWSHGGLLNYHDYSRYAYVPGGATIIRKSFWRQFPWNENLFWNEHEDVELCRRIQRRGHIIQLSNAYLIAHQDRWIADNPVIPMDFEVQQLVGHPVAEQRMHFQDKI